MHCNARSLRKGQIDLESFAYGPGNLPNLYFGITDRETGLSYLGIQMYL